MASDWDIVVVGGANTDYLVRGPRLPRSGETVEGDTFQIAPGGKGANQAVAAARMGARVAMVARLGDERAEPSSERRGRGYAVRHMRQRGAHRGCAGPGESGGREADLDRTGREPPAHGIGCARGGGFHLNIQG